MTGHNSQQFSFVETEHKILDFWREKDIFKKSLEKTKNNEPYIFYDGPPFATGLPHHGHLVISILKDVVPRYFTMKGKYVQRRWGWDCHGLPIEHEIDKKLGMSTQDAIEKIGIAGYNQECRAIVNTYTQEWQKTIDRLGRWVDFENDYKTMDPEFMESVWWTFKQLWDKGFIYKGSKVVPFSTALGTVLSNSEASENYQNVQDPAITVLMESLDEENTYYAAWTTTPWTLPSNLGLCVGPDIDYVKVRDEDSGQQIYMAKSRMAAYEKRKKNISVVSECKGIDLKGKKYKPLFQYFTEYEQEGAFQIFVDDYVSTDNGTGIVHQAPSFGEDDSRVFAEAGIHLEVCPVDDQGRFTEEVIDFRGLYVKDADKQIITRLKNDGTLYDQEVIVHSYPFCPRSDTPLIYKTIPSWYVAVEKIKPLALEAAKEINWVPGFIKEGRFGKWLENARDWAVSRNRVWGTPIPIWENDVTQNRLCMGSYQELENYTGVKLEDHHREFVDDLTFEVDGEQGTYRKIPEVLDCWFESGSMPYAQLHYPFENKEYFRDGFPAEYIAEGIDQTRCWFYYLTVISAALFEKPAFKNVIVNGIVLAEDGKKMSKRLRNYTAPDILMEEFGADAFRLYLINSGLVKAEEQRFSDSGVKEMVRRVLLPWYNSFKFFSTYAKIDGWKAETHFELGSNITDRWILSNLQTLKASIAIEMNEYRLYNVIPTLFTFIEDLTNWYIRLNRARFWQEGVSEDKYNAYSTLFLVLKELSLVMAPFVPFMSEYMYQELGEFGELAEESVHLCDYPIADVSYQNTILEQAVDRAQQIILLGRQKRNQKQIKVKTPLSTLTIIHQDQSILDELKKLEGYIKNELNVKVVAYDTDELKYIDFCAKPNSPVLGKKLGGDFKKYMALIKELSIEQIVEFEKEGKIVIDEREFQSGELLIDREAKEGTDALSNRLISVDLDCSLNDDLIDEGLAREVVSSIQKARKEQGFEVVDKINVSYQGDERILKAISQHKEYIDSETLTEQSRTQEEQQEVQIKIDAFNFSFTLEKA